MCSELRHCIPLLYILYILYVVLELLSPSCQLEPVWLLSFDLYQPTELLTILCMISTLLYVNVFRFWSNQPTPHVSMCVCLWFTWDSAGRAGCTGRLPGSLLPGLLYSSERDCQRKRERLSSTDPNSAWHYARTLRLQIPATRTVVLVLTRVSVRTIR